MKSQENCGRKENILHLGILNSTVFLLFEQEVSHFHFAVGSENYTAGLASAPSGQSRGKDNP